MRSDDSRLLFTTTYDKEDFAAMLQYRCKMLREEHNDWTNIAQEEYYAAKQSLIGTTFDALEKSVGKIG